MPSRAYVTFLAGDGDCVGVVGLAKGLKKVKTVYPLVVSIYSCGFVTNCPREDCKSHIVNWYIPRQTFFICNQVLVSSVFKKTLKIIYK